MKKLLCIVVFAVLFLSGCSDGNKNSTALIEDYEWRYDKNYSMELIDKKTSQLIEPKGIAVLGNELYVCDFEQNAIIILDQEGNFKREVGQLGSAPGEFIGPTGIAVNNQCVCVIDSGNNRVQIFNHELNSAHTPSDISCLC